MFENFELAVFGINSNRKQKPYISNLDEISILPILY